MNLNRGKPRLTVRSRLGWALALLLVIAPPLNLVSVAASSPVPAAVHMHGQGEHRGQDSPGLAHHAAACLQCLAMGGMSLAGAPAMPDLLPHSHATAANWPLVAFRWDSRAAHIPVCRGPPAGA
jgi:hypothetical protein